MKTARKVGLALLGVIMLAGFATLCVVGFRSTQNYVSEPVLQAQEGQPSVPEGHVAESVVPENVQLEATLDPTNDGPVTVSATFTPHFSANPKISAPASVVPATNAAVGSVSQ